MGGVTVLMVGHRSMPSFVDKVCAEEFFRKLLGKGE